jgi:hypothetical protein
MQRLKLERTLSLVSPMELYTSGTIAIIDPMRRTTRLFVPMGRLERLSLERFSGPLSLGQSVLVVAPYIIPWSPSRCSALRCPTRSLCGKRFAPSSGSRHCRWHDAPFCILPGRLQQTQHIADVCVGP